MAQLPPAAVAVERFPAELFDGGPYFSVDVECVATDTTHNGRSVAQIACVNEYGQVVYDVYVKPPVPVVSYLTPLTSIEARCLDNAMPLELAVRSLLEHLPPTAVLVGQSPQKDCQWLGLTEGVHFRGMLDLAGLYRVYNPQYKSWSVFSQDHVHGVMFGGGEAGAAHTAAADAGKSMALFHKFRQLATGPPEEFAAARAALLAAPPAKSFAVLHPSFEGVCMGGRRTCTCAQPFVN